MRVLAFRKRLYISSQKGVFDRSRKRRFEATFTYKDDKQKKSVLVIGLNPVSEDISIIDTATIFLLNNLIPMGYTMKRFVKCFFELLTQNFSAQQEKGVQNVPVDG